MTPPTSEATIGTNRLIDGAKIDNLPSDTVSELALKEDLANKGQPNGYASLDGTGKIPLSELPVHPGGDVVGPSTSVAGNAAVFSDSTGKEIEDSSISLTSFNGPKELVALDPSGKLPALNGSQLTDLPSSGHVIQDEGTSLPQRSKINFKGAGVTATDNAGADATDVTVPGGSGSGNVVGPSTAVDSNFAAFDTTTGKLIKDAGAKASDFATAAQGGKADTAVQPAALAGYVPVTQNVLTKEPTGFDLPENVIINYDPTTQKVTLTGTPWAAYWQGTVIAALTNGYVSAAHTNTTGHTYFLYHDGSNFAWSTDDFPGFDKLLIAKVVYNASDKFAVRECHGLMQWQVHQAEHNTIGTYVSAGGTIPSASFVLDSTTAANRRPDIDQTTLYDEDLKTVNPALTSKAYCQVTLTGAGVTAYAVDQADIVRLLTNNPYYNSFSTPNWGQTLFPSNSVGTVWIYAQQVTASAGSQKYRYLFVQPQWITQAAGSSAGQLLTALNAELARNPSELNLGTLRTEQPELVCIGRIAITYTSSNWSLRSVLAVTGTKYQQIASPSGNFLSTVVSDTSLTGSGTGASPLSIAPTISDRRINPRVVTVTQAAEPAINVDNGEVFSITGLAQAITSLTTNLTGTPVVGQIIEVQITDNGTPRAIATGTSFVDGPGATPAITVASTTTYIVYQWNGTKWVCLAPTSGSSYALSADSVTFTRDISLTTDLVINHSLGKIPTSIEFCGLHATGYASFGFYRSGQNNSTWSIGTPSVSTTACITAYKTAGNFNAATVSAISSTSFTLSWSKTGSPTNTDAFIAKLYA